MFFCWGILLIQTIPEMFILWRPGVQIRFPPAKARLPWGHLGDGGGNALLGFLGMPPVEDMGRAHLWPSRAMGSELLISFLGSNKECFLQRSSDRTLNGKSWDKLRRDTMSRVELRKLRRMRQAEKSWVEKPEKSYEELRKAEKRLRLLHVCVLTMVCNPPILLQNSKLCVSFLPSLLIFASHTPASDLQSMYPLVNSNNYGT